MIPDDILIEHDTTAHQFQAGVDRQLGFLKYRRAPGRITFVHTEVPESLRDHGIAAKLARAGLEFAKAESLRVIVACPYVKSYIDRHPEYVPLLRDR